MPAEPRSQHRDGPFRLTGKTAAVMGGGQTPGITVGNGRATAALFARQGARVFVVDRDRAAAQATVDEITEAGGEAVAWEADVTDEAAVEAAIGAGATRWGRLDILHNNVGVSLAAGDAPVASVTSDAFDRVVNINLKAMIWTCKHAVGVMRSQGSGVIVNVSSVAAIMDDYPNIAYKTSKSGVIALTKHLAAANAEYGIRANAILPGLINTPMAVEARIGVGGDTREEVIAKRDAKVPLGHKMGTAADIAHAALFLASDEARFVTGVALAVDGGQSLRFG